MAESSHGLDGLPGTAPAVVPELRETVKAKRRKSKLRSAWISFVGRIIAQFIGAAATVALGLLVLHKAQGPTSRPDDAALRPAPVNERSAPAPRERRAGAMTSVAVLPFASFSSDPAQNHFADAMTEALISALAQTGQLRVMSRTSAMAYRGTMKRLPAIGQELGVDLIVEGSVLSADGRIRVIAQLVDARTDEHLWSANYVRPLRKVLSLQDEVAGAIVGGVRSALSPALLRRIAAAPGARTFQWQTPEPESWNDAPATGTNSQR